MDVLIIQPPLMQLNTAYPSGAYLSAFFKRQEFSQFVGSVRWLDLNIALFYRIFSRAGLEKLFSLCSEKALRLADSAEKRGEEAVAFNLRRYVSEKQLWIDWIEKITDLLRADKSGFENAHRFVFGAHVPHGNRMEQFIETLDHSLSTDDARSLATCAIADIADFITAAFDENFSLIRYAESLTVSENTFEQIEKGADAPILAEFYEPLLREIFTEKSFFNLQEPEKKTLVLVSVPFAGTFTPALCTGRYFKQAFGNKVFVCLGGGFINTELRSADEPALANYCDALSYDRGYGGYEQILMDESFRANFIYSGENPLFKLRMVSNPCDFVCASEKSEAYEKEVTKSLVPDFSDIDFSVYPRLIDDKNPMHRLWSDGAWIKAYMAHGCYWHKCAFCDVTLDYVCNYCPVDVHALFDSLLKTARQKGVYGIHFVDEAMPPSFMIAFAKENIKAGSPLTWWGNIRFEKTFTRDVADFLAAGGLIGVSAGLESATGNGLSAIHKGTDLKSIVAACCAFKEAGVLVHAYMIYGYWWEKPLDLINSMETLRQFYANGLLDSCFWHKFVLTRHSRAYKEWSEGKIPDLKPLEEKKIPLFAKNGLHFEGEEKSAKYGRILDYSLNQWMHGEDLEKPVRSWFNFSMPAPNVPKDFIERLITDYEKKRDKAFAAPLPENKGRIFWLGSEKIRLPNKKVGWFYMGEFFEERADAHESAFRGRGLCVIP